MIRKVQDTDYEQIVSLLQTHYPTHNRFSNSTPHEIIGYLLTIKDESYVYVTDEQIVGYAILVQNKQNSTHSIFKYRHLAFTTETVGQELVAYCETQAMEFSETAKIELTIAENETDIQLYENMGYEKEATLSNHYRMDEDCYVYSKTLMRE